MKKKIQEVCGLNDLNREEKINRAREILHSKDLKQAICHQIQGSSYRDIEKAMKSIIDDRRPSKEEEEQEELERIAPEKLTPEVLFPNTRKKKYNKPTLVPLTQEQVTELLLASEMPNKPNPPPRSLDYPTLTREQVQALLEGRDDLLGRK